MSEYERVTEAIEFGATKEYSTQEAMACFPGVVAHIIAESLGYATPSRAASILSDALAGRPNHCEWISACFGGDPRSAVVQAIESRAGHKGYMASYEQARQLVDRALETKNEPMLGSWF